MGQLVGNKNKRKGRGRKEGRNRALVIMVWASNPAGGEISQHDAGKFGNLL